MIQIGIIGCGYWGPNLIRNFISNENYKIVAVADLLEERLRNIHRIYPVINLTTKAMDVINNPDIDAIAIATPLATHFDLAKEALVRGKHVMVEKPLTAKVSQAEELINIARKNGLILMVDHTFVYTGAVRKIKEVIDNREIGEIYYFDSVRINLGLFQHDTNVIWDLAVHDLSIMDYILGRLPLGVSVRGEAHVDDHMEDIAYLNIDFENRLIAHFHVNWLAPVKVRLMLIGGSKKMIVYDDNEPSEKVKIYDRGISIKNNDKDNVYKTLVQYRTGDMYAPKLDQTEALELVVDHFFECIRDGKKPITDGESGLHIVRMLESAQKSLENNGERVML